jgi:hypothetical protein
MGKGKAIPQQQHLGWQIPAFLGQILSFSTHKSRSWVAQIMTFS